MSKGFFVWYSLLVSLVLLEALFGSPRNVLLATHRMEVHEPVFLKSGLTHPIRRKPIGNIFSRELPDAENIPKGQVNAPCREVAYDFDVAFFNKKFMHGGSQDCLGVEFLERIVSPLSPLHRVPRTLHRIKCLSHGR
jgi:hypothetical protein